MFITKELYQLSSDILLSFLIEVDACDQLNDRIVKIDEALFCWNDEFLIFIRPEYKKSA
jgi:hypothetical protein